jgi:hypothetical protein
VELWYTCGTVDDDRNSGECNMARRKTKAQAVVEETGVSWEDFKERAIRDAAYEEPKAELEPDLELQEEEPVEEEIKLPNSVVAPKFKDKYIANAIAQGAKEKAARRSNWDWLAQEIAKQCLDPKGKIDIDSFKYILSLNEVDYLKWTNRNKGWEGRFRMTGRVALQKRVANNGVLRMGDADDAYPPAEWIAKYKTKA